MNDEEKMQKLQEAMDNFLSSVAQRAYTADSVNDIMSKGSSSSEVKSTINNSDLDVQSDIGTDSSDSWYDTKSSTDSHSHGTDKDFSNMSDSFFSNSELEKDEEDEKFDSNQSLEFSASDFKKSWMDAMYATKAFYDNEKMSRRLEDERKRPIQPKQCNTDVVFKKNTAMFNGKPFEYKVLQKEADWGTAFTKSFSMDDKITNLDKLNKKIIEDIRLNFGDLSRVTEIAVVSGMLIINGVQYYPLCRDKEFLDGLPFDCADYFKEGLIAEIFDFGYLNYMPYLTCLKIDSMDFVIRKFSYDIGIRGNFRVPLVFKNFKNLKYFEIGDTTFEAPGIDVNSEVQESIERHSRASDIYDSYIINNASSFRGWTFNNLKTYACNRGDKGFFRYSGGVLARGAMSVTAGVGELGIRSIGAVVKGGAHLLKKAFTEDI